MIVSDIGIDGIIGLDFMKKHACTISLVDDTIVIDNHVVSLEMAGQIGCYRVCLDKPLSVPSRAEIVTFCEVRNRTGDVMSELGLGVVEPIDQFTKSDRGLVARTLSNCSDKVPVRIMNIDNEDQLLQKDTCMAMYSPVSEVYEGPNVGVKSTINDRALPTHVKELFERTTKSLTSEQQVVVSQFLAKYSDTFARDDNDLGRTSLAQHRINTKNAEPIRQVPRRLPVHMQAEVDSHIESMNKKKVIQPSNSPWASPIVLVKKKDGSTRFCVDYRWLNDVTTKDAYPLPRIDESLSQLSGMKWFSTLDLCSGYWQVEVHPDDQPKTAFTTRRGLYEFTVMPFGLCNAPATFERLMETVLRGLQFDICLVYLDDIIVLGRTFDEMIQNLTQVFDRLAKAGLKLKAKKCTLFAKQVEYLGHVVSEEGIQTSPEKTQAIDNWPIPRNVTEVRSFLGLCSYYRKFVKDFALIASPLHSLTKKGNAFMWTAECQMSFDELRKAMVTTPILASPDFSQPFILDTDASDKAIGAVLLQVIDGNERVCAYASRTLSKSERKYCVTRKELLAVVQFVKHFKHYLYGRRFLVRTDHSSLRWLINFRNPENQLARWLEVLARWLEVLSQYEFDIQHRSGRLHGNADALSRIPCKQCGYKTNWEDEAQPETSCVMSVLSGSISIRQLQEQDRDLQKLRSWLDKKERPHSKTLEGDSFYLKSLYSQYERLCEIDGVLYRKWDDLEAQSSIYQALVPLRERRTVLQYCHDAKTAGHLGIKKMLQKIRSSFYWPNLQTDVGQYIAGCDFCTKRKGENKTKRAPMQMVETGYPMERIATDILGELPTTKNGNEYILVVSDYYTKWTESFPMANMEAQTVARIIVDEVVSRFGVPNAIHSDQGSQFESNLFQEMCTLLGVKKTHTTPYHPQSDGMVERFNRTLTTMLSAFVNDNHTDWDEQLPYVMMAYRSSIHETTGFTPNSLMLGREVSTPLDILYEMPSPMQAIPQSRWVWVLQERLQNAHSAVRAKASQEMVRQKQYHDRKLHWEKFNPGDRVCVFFPRTQVGKSSKFTSFWKGPYVVKKRMSDVTYVVDCGRHGKDQVIHVDRMRPLRSQILTGEDDIDRDISGPEQTSPHDIEQGAAKVDPDKVGVQSNKSDSEENCDSDAHDKVLHRPFRSRRPPVWLKDYKTDF